jgi:type II secretory pathway pseudopilin PulG
MAHRRRIETVDAKGLTLIELMFTMALGVTITGIAVPLMGNAVDAIRAASAARYMAARIMSIRMEAVRRSTCVAFRFQPVGTDYAFAPFEDGNGNGIRTMDIQAGIDRQLAAYERLGDKFSGVQFRLAAGTPDADGVVGPGEDGVRIGAPQILTLSPDGSASSGTLYLGGKGGQYAVRVLGVTGRTRVLYFHPGDRTWSAR